MAVVAQIFIPCVLVEQIREDLFVCLKAWTLAFFLTLVDGVEMGGRGSEIIGS